MNKEDLKGLTPKEKEFYNLLVKRFQITFAEIHPHIFRNKRCGQQAISVFIHKKFLKESSAIGVFESLLYDKEVKK